MDCGAVSPKKSLFTDEKILMYEFGQAWAEAYQIYKSGKFSLTMPKELDEYIESLQEDFKEDDPLVGIIQGWLDSHDDDYTCNIQIAEKALGIYEKPDRKTINQIAEIMNNSITGWKKGSTHRFAEYNQQRCYERVRDSDGFRYLKQDDAIQESLPFE